MDSLPTTAIVTAVAACLVYFLYQKALPQPIPGIPYDEAAAKNVLGSLPSMIAHLKKHGVVLPWLTGHNDKHRSPLIQFFGAPFSQPTVIMCDFQESQDVLLRRTKEFDRATRSTAIFAGIMPEFHLGMRSSSPKFKGNKELIRDLMSPNFLHEVSAPQIYNKSLALIDLWSEKQKVAGDRPFEARQDIFDAAMDMINAAAFAFEDDLSITKQKWRYLVSKQQEAITDDSTEEMVNFINPQIPEDIGVLQNVADFLGGQSTSPFPQITYWYRILTDSILRRNITLKDKIIKAQIKECSKRLKEGDGTQLSATDFMIQRESSVARKENRAPDIYSRRIVDELFGYIVAGHETTSSSLSWMLKLISDHQSVQHELRHVLRTVFDAAVSESRQPTAHEIAKADIPFLDAVIDECLRIGGPAPMVAREAMTDTVLLGHHIPKGMTLLINNAGPGFKTKPVEVVDSTRSESSIAKTRGGTWNVDDLHLFKPERWLKTNDKGDVIYDAQAGPFLTFSLGPRGCFGRRLAYLEIRLILVLLLWNFHFKQLKGELVSYDTKESVTVMPKVCYVELERL